MKLQIKILAAWLAVVFTCQGGEPLPGIFTTNMAARRFPSVSAPGWGYAFTSWERGVIVQGPMNNTTGRADIVRFARGGQIAQDWYETFDANQGWIVMWVRPEWNGNDGKERCFLQWSPNGYLKKTTANELVFSMATGVNVATNISSWTAGVTYRIDACWNAYNTVNGTHYLGLGVNQTNVFGRTSAYTPEPIAEYIHIGSTLQSNCAANAIIAGVSILRRYDTNLVFAFNFNLTNGHNVASWDMPFGLAVYPSSDCFTGGVMHAHTHPFTNFNLLLGNNRLGGYMLAGAYATDGWSLEGAPTVAVVPAAQRCYRGGYMTTSSGANQGLYQDISVAAGADMVMRVVAHSDGTGIPRAIFYNQTAGAVIGQRTGRASSTRLNPDILILSCEAPAGCATVRIKLVNTQAFGSVYWHQVEVFTNLITNPSLETGAGNPWIPTGWASGSYQPNDTFQETVNVWSGASAARIEQKAFGWRGYWINVPVYGTFNSAGWHGCRVSGGFHSLRITPSWKDDWYEQLGFKGDSNSNYWHHACICKIISGVEFRDMDVDKAFLDDVYLFSLRNVALQVTPASPAESIEDYYGLRVDGFDRFMGVYSGLGTTAGSLCWYYLPRHSASCAIKFGHPVVSDMGYTNAHAYIATLWGNSDNFIRLYWASNDVMRLRYRMNGAEAAGDWRGTGIEAGKGYRMQLYYRTGNDMCLFVHPDGSAPPQAPAIKLTGIPAAFAVGPSNVCWGARWDGTNATFQGDAVFAPWPRGTVIRIF